MSTPTPRRATPVDPTPVVTRPPDRAGAVAARSVPAAATAPQDTTTTWQRALFLPLTILAWLAVGFVALWLLGHVTRALLMVVLAAVLAFALAPLARFLGRWLPRPLALGLAYLIGVALVFGLGAFVVSTAARQAGTLVAALPEYAQRAQNLEPRAEALLQPFGVTAANVQDTRQQVLAGVSAVGAVVASDVLSRAAELAGAVVDTVLVLILSVYFASLGPRVARWLREETPTPHRHRAELLIAVVNRVVGGYVRGTLTLAVLIGALVGVGLAVLGVPYAVLLGVLAFFMEFIPVLGVLISGVAAVGVAALNSWQAALIVLGYFVVVHVIEGDVVGPRIMGKAVGIHPATGLVALVAGTELFGVWGALFAAPLAGLLQAFVTAAYLEVRGGAPQEVLRAVADEAAVDTLEHATSDPAQV